MSRNDLYEPAEPMDMAEIPFPYEDLPALSERILYYETSRGCPGHCAFCLSGGQGKVRFAPLDKVKKELEYFFAAKVKQIKLVDRTFNCQIDRACRILEMVLALDTKYERRGQTNFHMEIRGDQLNEEFLTLLAQAPPGLFQLEVGLQSTFSPTRDAIHRHDDLTVLEENCRRIRSFDNVHLHLDLIAGLPHEDMGQFEHSFNAAYKMQPHMLQLGFLKVLRGSELGVTAKKLGILYAPYPPYEVLSTPWMSFEELSRIKDLEAFVEWTYNMGIGLACLQVAIDSMQRGAFALFMYLVDYFKKQGLLDRPLSLEERFSGIFDALSLHSVTKRLPLEGLLRHDWACLGRSNHYPSCLKQHTDPKDRDRMLSHMTGGGFLEGISPESLSYRARLCQIEHFDPPIPVDGQWARSILYHYQVPQNAPFHCRYLIIEKEPMKTS